MGYCQGMNFVCAFFLDCGFEEEEVFWLLCHLFEEVSKPIYFASMVPALIDIRFFRYLVSWTQPELTEFMKAKGIDLNMLLLPFFVTFFCTLTNHSLKMAIMDTILFEGMLGVFKLFLVCFDMLREPLTKTSDLIAFKICFEAQLNEFSRFDELRTRLEDRYINRKLFSLLRGVVTRKEWPKFEGQVAGRSRSKFLCVPGLPCCYRSEETFETQGLPQVYATEDVLESLSLRYFANSERPERELRLAVMPEVGSFMSQRGDTLRCDWIDRVARPVSPEPPGPDRATSAKLSAPTCDASLQSSELSLLNQQKSEPGPKIRDGDQHLLLFRKAHKCYLGSKIERKQARVEDLKRIFFRESQGTFERHSGIKRRDSHFGFQSLHTETKPIGPKPKFPTRESFERNGRTNQQSRRSLSLSRSRYEDPLFTVPLEPKPEKPWKKMWTIDIEEDDGFVDQLIPDGMEQLLFEEK